jgi:GTPase SAR1 family protein
MMWGCELLALPKPRKQPHQHDDEQPQQHSKPRYYSTQLNQPCTTIGTAGMRIPKHRHDDRCYGIIPKQQQQQQRQQQRFMGAHHNVGGSHAEEYYISTAFSKFREKPPQIVIQCERVQLVGCNLLPQSAQHMINAAKIRFRVITHADTVSLSVLKHQIAYVEEQERRLYNSRSALSNPAAVFALNLNDANTIKDKQMKSLADAIFGACSIVGGQSPILVCGIPNSGKSSLILTLTRSRTMKVKNKKEYHLPKISVQAGRTLGTKTHVMAYSKNHTITFMDSPGLRPRLELLEPPTIRLLLATKSVEPFKNYIKYIPNNDLLKLLLQAANNYTRINYEVGMMLRRTKTHTVITNEVLDSPPLPDYASAFGLPHATEDPNEFMDAYYKTTKEKVSKDPLHLVRMWQAGNFGSWMFTPYRREYITTANIATMSDYNPDSPVIYMNPAGYEYRKKALDFGKLKKRTIQNMQNEINEKIEQK